MDVLPINAKCEWGDSDSKLLLDLYHEFLPQVGPMKKFRNKKAMWQTISDNIKSKLHILRTAGQCETRYKTIIKRKTHAISNNKTSGEVKEDVPFQEELEKIKSLDDSVQPEILVSSQNMKVLKPASSSNITAKGIKRKNVSSETGMMQFLKELHAEKERNKERRHQEKLQLIKELFSADKKT